MARQPRRRTLHRIGGELLSRRLLMPPPAVYESNRDAVGLTRRLKRDKCRAGKLFQRDVRRAVKAGLANKD